MIAIASMIKLKLLIRFFECTTKIFCSNSKVKLGDLV